MSLFPDKRRSEAAIKILKSRLALVPVLENVACKISDEFLLLKLQAAEAELRRRIRIFLEPTWVFAEDATEQEIDARQPEYPYVQEAGYDYDPREFGGRGSWGFIVTKHTPVLSVESLRFVYSDPKFFTYTIPLTWIRLDKKYGHIRLLPTGELATLPINGQLLNIFSNGRTIPQMIRLTYLAGIKDVAAEYPDLYDFLFRVATLLLIVDRFPGNSSSISADGLSRSASFDIKSWIGDEGGAIDTAYVKWRQFFHGQQMIVL